MKVIHVPIIPAYVFLSVAFACKKSHGVQTGDYNSLGGHGNTLFTVSYSPYIADQPFSYWGLWF